MKLTLILLIAFVLHAGARGTAQTVTLTVKDMLLEKVCKEIEKQTGYFFVYARDMNQSSIRVSISTNHARVEEALHQVFDQLPYTFQVIEKVVVINTLKKVAEEKTIAIGNVPDEAVSVRGQVLNEDNQPLAGATIMIKVSGKTTMTNIRGDFSFTREVPLNSVLVVSYIGYSPQQVVVKDDNFIRIRLAAATNELDAMVIKGYYNTTNRLNTGNVTTVKGEDIRKQPVTDPLLALEGRVPGLYIQQNSGLPGAFSKIYLRGQNSIPRGKPITVNDPLFIVDGVPYSSATLSSINLRTAVGTPAPNSTLGETGQGFGLSPFNNLNPADVESIEILKDADATAIYGSRGSNGVVLITTRKGKVGQTRVDIDGKWGISKVMHTMDLMNTREYLQMRREAFYNDNKSPNPNADFDLTYWDTTRYTDWQKFLIGNAAHYEDAQVSVSGGNVNTQFLVSGGYSSQGTVFPGTYGDNKVSVHFNINNISTDRKFQLQLTGGYANDNNRLPQSDFTGSVLLAPNAPAPYDALGNLNWAMRGGKNTWFNPFNGIFIQAGSITDNLLGNLMVGYQIINGLQIKASVGYNHTQMNQSNIIYANSVPPPDNNNPNNRQMQMATADNKSWIIEPQLDYHRQWNELSMAILLGSTFQENKQTSIASSAYGFSSDALVTNPTLASSKSIDAYGASQYRYNAFYGRISATWKEKYLLNLTARRDGSSRFGPDKQFGNFGAVGAGWIFSSEPFIRQMLPWLSFGKLRGSYGVTGNDQIGDYQYMSTYSVISSTYQGAPGLYPTLIANPYFAWERNNKLEGGIEMGLLKDKLMLTADFYRNRTDNQLVGYPLSQLTGFSTIQANLPAVIQNTGWEFTINSIILRSKDFAWNISLNLSIPRNKLVSFPGIQNTAYNSIYAVGQSLFVRYLYHYMGVDPQTGIYAYATKKGAGNPTFGVDNVFTKPITQDFFGGIQNSFQYKGWQLDILVQFVKQVKNNYWLYLSQSPGYINTNMPKEALSRWVMLGDRASVQKFTQSFSTAALNFLSYFKGSDAILSDASFLRLKNLALSYQFPKVWIQRVHLQSVKLYVYCQNLFTITKFQLLDPESSGLRLPPLRTITAGIHVGL